MSRVKTSAASVTPVTLITGYLGSGKTTLVNALLRESQPEWGRTAVIVNEFGSVGIDGALLEEGAGPEGKVIELANGCLCCVVTGEFRATLDSLPKDRYDRIVIETSGAADPTGVIRMFWGAPELTERYRLDAVVCVVDSIRFERQIAADTVALLQASVADVVVLSKCDAPDAQASRTRERILALNPSASLLERDESRGEPLALGQVLGLDAYRKARPQFLKINDAVASHGALTSVALSWEGQVSRAAMQAFFRSLMQSEHVVRTKAILHVEGERQPWLIQGVQTWLERSKAPKSYRGPNRLVVLGHGLNQAQLEEALKHLRHASR